MIEGVGSPMMYQSTENTNDKVGGYADLNLSAEYKIHKISVFSHSEIIF
jgi:hypothetical protein